MFKNVNNLVSVKISSNYAKYNNSLNGTFFGCTNLKSFHSNINGMKKMNMSYMFKDCTSLSTVIFENLTTTVEDSNHMFDNCLSLTSLELNSINTNNVKNMSYMFSNCSLIKKLNITSYNIREAKDLSYMFNNCYSLEELNINQTIFEPKNLSNISITDMFYNCSDDIIPDWYKNIPNITKY